MQQPLRFLEKTRICRHPNGDITVSLERSYYYSMLKHMDLDDNSNPTSTPSLRRPPVQQDVQLDPDRTSHLSQSCGHAHLGIIGMSRPPVHSKRSYSISCSTYCMGLDSPRAYTQVHQGHTSLQVPHLTSSTSRTFTTTSTTHPVAHQRLLRFLTGLQTSKSRMSTSGAVTSVLGVPLALNSRTQSTVATSSAEAELYAIGLGISDSLRVYQLLQELQQRLQRATFGFGSIDTWCSLGTSSTTSTSSTTTNHRFTSSQTAHQPSISATSLASTKGPSTSR